MNLIKSDELKRLQVSILDAVHDFCIENKLNYSLAYGTLLGAIRHKGYIPWDDDIDIMLPRKDYDYFVNHFKHPYYRVVDDKYSKDYWFPFAKVVDTRTVIDELSNMPLKLGVNIDIFPVDNYPDDLKESRRLFNRKKIFNYLHNIKMIKISKNRSFIKNLILETLQVITYPIHMNVIVNKMIEISRSYQFSSTHWKGNIVSSGSRFEERVPSKWFDKTKDVEFEGKSYRAVSEYDALLKAMYGNWRELPPIEKQVTHHAFKAYWK